MRGLGRCIVLVAALAAVLVGMAPMATATQPKDCGPVEIYPNGTVGPVLCPGDAPNRKALKYLKSGSPHLMALTRSSSWVEIRVAICDDIRVSSATFPMAMNGYTYQFVRFDWTGFRPWPGTVHYRLAMGGVCGS